LSIESDVTRSAIRECLGDMTAPYLVGAVQVGAVQVGDGPGHPQNPMIAPGGQPQMFRRGLQQVSARLVRRGDGFEDLAIGFSVAARALADIGAGQPIELALARGRNPGRDTSASFLGRRQR